MHDADIIQLCAQALCLEEMLCCDISEGALFYGETRRRFPVRFDSELRNVVLDCTKEMHELFERGYTPKVKPKKGCSSCSLKESCMPKLIKNRPVSAYMREHLEDSL